MAGVINGDEILAINDKHVLGMKPLTLQHHLRGIVPCAGM